MSPRRILGVQLDRHTQVADVIVQEILTTRVRGPITGNANRIAEPIERGVSDVQRSVGGRRPTGIRVRRRDGVPVKAGMDFRPGPLSGRGRLVAGHRAPFEQNDLRRFGEFRIP